ADDPLLESISEILQNDATQRGKATPSQGDVVGQGDKAANAPQLPSGSTSLSSSSTGTYRGISPIEARAARALPWNEWPDEVKALTLRRTYMRMGEGNQEFEPNVENKDDNFPDAANNELYYQETDPMLTTTVQYANDFAKAETSRDQVATTALHYANDFVKAETSGDQVAELEDYQEQKTVQTPGDAN
ncbi:unnamed protein product, partial [Symbiodinium sp. KB8]